MNWEMLADRVLVKTARAARTEGGILLPDSAEEKPQRGVVVAVGPGAPRQMSAVNEAWPMGVEVGDEVLFTKHGGMDVGDLKALAKELEGHVILTERDIVARRPGTAKARK